MKTVIVTGAASGIGLAVVKKFLTEGYAVYGMSRREESPITHKSFHYISGDISVAADRERLVAAPEQIDVLVNVAGVAPKVRADLLEMTEESYGGLVDDLFALTENAPESFHSDQTHYYTPEGTELLAGHVVETLENVLSIKGKPLEYKQLFVEAKNVIGE